MPDNPLFAKDRYVRVSERSPILLGIAPTSLLSLIESFFSETIPPKDSGKVPDKSLFPSHSSSATAKFPKATGRVPVNLLFANEIETKFVDSAKDSGIEPYKELLSIKRPRKYRKLPMLVGMDPERPNDEMSIELTKPREQITFSQLHNPGESGMLGTVHSQPMVRKLVTSFKEFAKLHIVTCSTRYVGATVGAKVGLEVGVPDGTLLGSLLGCPEGVADGVQLG